jgi:Ca-activated chloride channel homolog
MNNIIKLVFGICLFLPSSALLAWQWPDLWHTADQQGAALLQKGKTQEAAHVFKDKDWQAVAQYKAGDYAQAFKQFSSVKTSDDQYNAGNAAAFSGKYPEAIAAYDKAVALNSNNTDAIANREIVKKLQAKKEQQENKSSEKDSKDKKQQASSQQNKDQKNSSAKNKDDKQSAQNDAQKNKQDQANKDQPTQKKEDDKSQAQNNKAEQKPDGQKFDDKPPNETVAASSMQNQDEDKKQLLRRLADDPGGLLRQKFMRDYYRRHPNGEYLDPGEN